MRARENGVGPGRPGPRSRSERRLEMTTLRITARYARYLLTSLATVVFGLNTN
jgi:hypothetical protein